MSTRHFKSGLFCSGSYVFITKIRTDNKPSRTARVRATGVGVGEAQGKGRRKGEREIGEIGSKKRGVDVGGPGRVGGRGLRVHEGDIEAG